MKLQHISAIPLFIKDNLFSSSVLFCFSDKEWEQVFKNSLSVFRIRFSTDFSQSGLVVKLIKDALKEIIISDSNLFVKVGVKKDISEVLNFLIENGYKRVPQDPYSEGEFCLIGDIFEIRIQDFKLRIEFLFDKIEKIYVIKQGVVEKRDEFYIPSLNKKSVKRFVDVFDEVVSFCDSDICSEHSKGRVKDIVAEVKNYKILSPYDFVKTKDDIFELIRKDFEITFAVKYSYEESSVKNYFGSSVKVARANDYPFGFIIPELKKALIPFDVFYSREKRKKTSLKFPEISYEELKEGTYVVHKVHGIGIFRGTSVEYGREFLKIEYKDSAFLYIPAEDIGLLYKYIGIENPPLDEIGGKTFALRVARVRQHIEKQIADFMRVLSIRKSIFRPPYKGAEEVLLKVEETFPYEETEDQKKAIDEIVSALCNSNYPIDYLVVGDSGVGKTEVALRAACVVAYAGKQVAIIAPTTVLALQHYMRISERLRELPFKVAMLSRLTSKSEQQKVIEGIKSGEIDIVIGTHKVINVLPYFKDLGLLILDEEHRFGVEQKEKISRIKATVDVISLSATPIPRTLKMALSGIKNIVVIKTKPPSRGTIITSLIDESKLKDVIEYEIKRGGQVLYITPFIETQSDTLIKIQKIFPDVPKSVLHGRMRPNEIEKILLLFMIGKIKILISTKIISLGIDIPSVNTMVIERADLFGLSELYQLRGRVGRGDKDAFCYLMIPDNISKSAKNRLDIFIETVNFKGESVGLHLSLKDIELRGAGNLFGKEQIGHIYSVGFETYLEILRELIDRMKEKQTVSFEPMVKIDIPAYIPSDVIPDNMVRISFYKAFANCETLEDVEEIYKMIVYRFLKDEEVPEELENFIKIVKLKVLMRKAQIFSAVFSPDLTLVELETKNGKMKIPVNGIDDLINLLLREFYSKNVEARL